VLPETLALEGDLVSEEVQLDGSRHLAWEAEASGWRCALQVVITRDGAAREGEVEVEGPAGAWSAALTATLAFSDADGVRLRARFAGEAGALVLTLEGRAEGCRITLERSAG
jgi:hypothetical protein